LRRDGQLAGRQVEGLDVRHRFDQVDLLRRVADGPLRLRVAALADVGDVVPIGG